MAAATGVPEHIIVREVLHCCQGIDGGKYVWYQGGGDNVGRFAVGPGADISPAQQQLISKIAELGWLLRQVKLLVEEVSALHSIVHEALVAAANKEVNNYYRLIAILEAQAQQQPAGADTAPGPPTEGGERGQLTLRRLEVWLAEPLQRLRVLASCLEAARPLRGGQVINALHAMSKHGDPLVRRVVSPLLEEACAPYFKQIARWVLDGSLDGADDFLVVRQLAANESPSTLWHAGFTLNRSMQPRFLTDDLAAQILTAGKTVSFLRQCCGDAEWAAALHAGAGADLEASGGTYRQLRWLEAAVGEVRRCVGGRLLELLLTRERLAAHLSGIKRYVLLGQGDFVRTLLDLAGPELDRPARELSAYSLQGHLETALRSCGAASGDVDLLPRVEVRLLRALEGDRGWDVFGIAYSLEGPAAAVLGPEAMAAYGRVSRLLWAVKHVDHAVARAWQNLDQAEHGLATLRALEREHGIDAVASARGVPPLLRQLHMRRAEMAQFVARLQAHLVYGVLEPAWGRLSHALPVAVEMDDVIAAHQEALAAVMQGMFLDASLPALVGEGSSAADGSCGTASDVQAALRSALRAVLDMQGPVLRLADAVEGAVAEQQAYLKRVKESEATGQWSDEVYRSPAGISAELLAEVQSGAWRVHSAFDRHLRTFLSLLPPHSHLDLLALLPLGQEGQGVVGGQG